MRHAVVAVLISFVALLLVACGGSPPHYICKSDAEQYIKRGLIAYPSTFDEHLTDSLGVGRELGKVMDNGDGRMDCGVHYSVWC